MNNYYSEVRELFERNVRPDLLELRLRLEGLLGPPDVTPGPEQEAVVVAAAHQNPGTRKNIKYIFINTLWESVVALLQFYGRGAHPCKVVADAVFLTPAGQELRPSTQNSQLLNRKSPIVLNYFHLSTWTRPASRR